MSAASPRMSCSCSMSPATAARFVRSSTPITRPIARRRPRTFAPRSIGASRSWREIGVPILGSEGYEADDVIATLVKKLKAQHPDLAIRIISKDKDLKQLLRDGVEMFDIHTDSVIDTKARWNPSGLPSDQIVDMLALMGDSVDNVPGVEGVGEKTSAELIKTWGTLDNLLANADKITGKRGEKIRAL